MTRLALVLLLAGCFYGPTPREEVDANRGRLMADCNAGVADACRLLERYP